MYLIRLSKRKESLDIVTMRHSEVLIFGQAYTMNEEHIDTRAKVLLGSCMLRSLTLEISGSSSVFTF